MSKKSCEAAESAEGAILRMARLNSSQRRGFANGAAKQQSKSAIATFLAV